MGQWTETFRAILCRLYRSWGGNCDGLSPDAWLAAQTVMACFPPAPTFSNDKERAEFLRSLDKLEGQLTLPDNPLTTQQTTQIEVWIDAVYQAVVPVPDCATGSGDGGTGSGTGTIARIVQPSDDEQGQRRAA